MNTFVLYPYPGEVSAKTAPALPRPLAALRKQRGFTQQALAERIGIHVVQLRRYEAGASQPTLTLSAAWRWLSA